MRSLRWRSLAAAACLAVVLVPARAWADGGVTLPVGHSWTKSFGNTPFESKPQVTVDKPSVASVRWSGEESGSLIITGVEEGEAVVTLKGKVRVAKLGTGGAVTVRDVTATVPVKVTGPDEYSKLAVLHVGQKLTVKFPKGMKLGAESPSNSNPSVVFVRRNSSAALTLRGKKEGESWLRFKLIVEEDGKEKTVRGTIWVQVKAGKPKKKYIRIGWDDLYIGEIIILNPGEGMDERGQPKDRRVGMAPDWPGTDGVYCTFVPSGRNYGDIGDLVIENVADEPVTVAVPPGLLLDSSDPAVQDLYVADVPSESPCEGAKDIGQPVTIQPDTAHVIRSLPGFCPDFEKAPPKQDDTGVYACRPPDEKSDVLLDTIAMAKAVDVGAMKLDVFAEDKSRAMVTQGALWMVDSQIDETQGNEVADTHLSDRFFETFTTSAKEALEKMSPENREKAEQLVKDDIKKIVQATAFVAKQTTDKKNTQAPSG
jgi:hypothetical protein